MLILVGKTSCPRCAMTKTILEERSIPFEYKQIQDLAYDEQTKIMNLARESGNLQFPIIIKDDKCISLEEV